MKNISKLSLKSLITFFLAFSLPTLLIAGEPTNLKLSLTIVDSIKTCKAIVTDEANKPLEGVSVFFYAKRSVGLLPMATAQKTDENGEASAEFLKDLPGDEKGNVTIVARLEDNEDILDQKNIDWGKKVVYKNSIDQEALWASRTNAPMYLIFASNFIIIGIWGTVCYVLFLLFFRMKKSGISKTK